MYTDISEEKRPALPASTGSGRNELIESILFFLVFLVLLLTSCAGPGIRPEEIVRQRETEMARTQRQADRTGASTRLNGMNGQITESSKAGPRFASGDYEVGPDDLLEISVFQVDELKSTVRVSANGYIKLPLVGAVKAEHMTVSQLENYIARRLQKYIEEPVVSVFVKEYRSQQIAVLGAVRDPRVYYVSGQKYLLDMISMAGGLSNEAGTICIVQRPSKNGKDSEKIVIDLDELLVNGKAELNMPLRSGDIVNIPESGIFFVDGGVTSPGSFPLKGKITVTQAISMAKGLAFEAEKDDIRIYRSDAKPDGKSQREMITLNYDSILKGKSPDIEIKDKDIIIVPKNGFKSFIKGLNTSIGGGFFRLGKGF